MKEILLQKEDIKNLYFVGRNYVDHIEELKNEKPQKPLIFTKPVASLCFQEKEFSFNYLNEDIHYECEAVLLIKKDGEKIKQENASNYVAGIGLGVDFTDRKAQQREKEKSIPWTLGKCQKNFAYLGKVFELSEGFSDVDFTFYGTGKVLQEGNSRNMLFGFEELLSYISNILPLKKGDLIYTGTPKGVGPVQANTKYTGKILNEESIDFKIISDSDS